MEVNHIKNIKYIAINRIGTEKRDAFGSDVKKSVGPGPNVYDVYHGAKMAKGKMSPKISMGSRFRENTMTN